MDELRSLFKILPSPLIAACALYMAAAVNKISESIQALNVKIAVIIERVDSQETRIRRIEDKTEMERKIKYVQKRCHRNR